MRVVWFVGVCIWDTEVHAACAGDVFGRQASKNPHDAWLEKSARYEWAKAIGFGEGRGLAWPFGTHHVDGGAWNAWVCACAK
jgi:hypothetical protein